MLTGKVNSFDQAKGYGFITPDDDPTASIFVHFSAIQTAGFKTLQPGQEVKFLIAAGKNGQQAVSVSVDDLNNV
ncbi:cold-shock protein [Liquorilactobacillus sicerae]|uniref:cold-shock protein n=1 Tax=Liquorilactobacillus sicerae TaxID=1416943 RepID=UPI002480E9E8|nr:cold shock domain-containing protein [Liquorilactobacillus sicerae]